LDLIIDANFSRDLFSGASALSPLIMVKKTLATPRSDEHFTSTIFRNLYLGSWTWDEII
jgi:hypothetical protein